MESALKLGDMGYKVLVVEKEPSVGGKMILLSKVFPTLDCASCISTPKMGATIHHPNIDVMTYAEVEAIRGNGGDGNGNGPVGYHAKIKQKPKFVDEAACTGCRQCEMACNVAVPDEYNADMVSRRAAFIAFPQAVPKKAVISREGVSPCSYECPAGIKAHGYVARVRSGEYDQAFDLVLETTPLVGSLGRACYAPCEGECTRGELEGPLPIRRLKRFIADERYGQAEPKAIEKPEQNGKKVAVVGSGPAGLTAAWQLARKGYGVKIYEKAERAGGFLALGIPAYRLPNDVVDDDIANVTAIGVEIETGVQVDDPAKLKDDGFDAVLVATGTHKAVQLRVPGEDKDGVMSALTFLADVKLGKNVDLAGRKVLVVGGGNVAIDAARTARRLGAAEVHQASLECCEDMPAHDFEVEEAKAEGITLHDGWGVNHFTGDDKVESAVLKVCTCVFDPERQVRARVRREPAADRGVRRRHRRRRHGRRHRGVRPRDQPEPDAQGRRGHVPDGGAARLRRRRRRHRPDDDHHRRRPGPPGGLHDRPLPPGRGPGRGRVRRGAPGRGQEERARAAGRLRPARAVRVARRDERVADRLRRDRGADDRG